MISAKGKTLSRKETQGLLRVCVVILGTVAMEGFSVKMSSGEEVREKAIWIFGKSVFQAEEIASAQRDGSIGV